MTQDYKDTLLEYLTNNLVEDSGYNRPSWSDTQIEEKDNIISELNTAFPYGYKQVGELQCKNSNGDYNGFTIVYGNYNKDSSSTLITNQRGYILLFNENMDKVALITQYSSGTYLNAFIILNIDEKGQLYGIDQAMNSQSELRNRFIMLNNISVKLPLDNYKCVLRQSYFVDGTQDSSYSIMPFIQFIAKDPNSSRYVLMRDVSSALELYIQVGASNEWTLYDTGSSFSIYTIPPVDNVLAIWDSNGELSITSFTILSANTPTQSYICKVYNTSSTMEVIQGQEITNNGVFPTYFEQFYLNVSGQAWTTYKSFSSYTMSTDFGYLVCGGKNVSYGNEYNEVGVFKIYMENNSPKLERICLYSSELDDPSGDNTPIPLYCKLINLNGTLFVNYYTTLNPFSNNVVYDFYTIWFKDNIDSSHYYERKTLASSEASMISKFHLFGIKNAYNLYATYYLGEDSDSGLIFLSKSNIIYNATNYNGIKYSDTNSLVPRQMLLYDENGVIFARNLYNKVVYNNITESTLQIPNTMLNDITIAQEDLYGETMYVLSSNDDEIEKNIYETLYINVFNKLNMVNNNDPSNPIMNNLGATRINQSVSEVNDYDNAKIGKVRINYRNGVSYTKDIISSTITNNVADIQFQLTIVSDILNIEILSTDEATIYQRIVDVSDYEVGKTYVISQKCHVE